MEKNLIDKQNQPIRLGLMVAIAVCAFILSACGGSIKNPPAPTSTPTVESMDSGGITVEKPTQIPLDIPTGEMTLEPTATVTAEDVCSLVTAYDVENVLGQTVISITSGSEPDEVSDSTLNYCTFRGSDMAVVISSVEVENSFIGGDILRATLQSNKDDEPSTVTNEELGVGVKAYWSVSENAGGYTVLTEEHIFSVVLGGNIDNPANHKAALLTLAQIVAEKQ